MDMRETMDKKHETNGIFKSPDLFRKRQKYKPKTQLIVD